MFHRLILWRGETNLIGQVFLFGSLGSYGDGGGTLLGPLYRSNVWKFLSVQVPSLKPRGGFDMFTYTGISGVFFGFCISKICCFFFGTGQNCCIFGGFLRFQQYFLGPVLFTRYFSKHSSSLLSSHT